MATKSGRIMVVSPHLDDAVLDCCNHVCQWLRCRSSVTVVTVFTSFRSPVVSEYQRHFMNLSGITSVEMLERRRKAEDIRAMRLVGASWRHLDFVDAGFRTHEGALYYRNYDELCRGKISVHDYPLLEALAESLASLRGYDAVLIPLGVGQQQDHLLVREAAERCFRPERIRYYLDFPYALNPRKWKIRQFLTLAMKRKSVKLMTRRKRSIMRCYVSQLPHLFRWKLPYPEVILGLPV